MLQLLPWQSTNPYYSSQSNFLLDNNKSKGSLLHTNFLCKLRLLAEKKVLFVWPS